MKLLILTLLMSFNYCLFSQADCSTGCMVLARDGFFNQSEYKRDYDGKEEILNELCNILETYNSDITNSSAKAKVKGFFGGSGNYTRQEIETMKKVTCSSNFSAKEISELVYSKNTSVSVELAKQFTECMKITCENQSLSFNINPRDAFYSEFTVTIDRAQRSNVEFTEISKYWEKKLDIDSDRLIEAIKKGKVIDEPYSATFRRKIDWNKAIPFDVDTLVEESYSLRIATTEGPILIDLPKIYKRTAIDELKADINNIKEKISQLEDSIRELNNYEWIVESTDVTEFDPNCEYRARSMNFSGNLYPGSSFYADVVRTDLLQFEYGSDHIMTFLPGKTSVVNEIAYFIDTHKDHGYTTVILEKRNCKRGQ